MYSVTATRKEERDGWECNRQIPTFYLDENTQGIVSVEHARQVAADILGNDCEINVAKL